MDPCSQRLQKPGNLLFSCGTALDKTENNETGGRTSRGTDKACRQGRRRELFFVGPYRALDEARNDGTEGEN